MVLADEHSPAFAAGGFCGLPQQFAVLERLPEVVQDRTRPALRRLRPRRESRRRAHVRAVVSHHAGAGRAPRARRRDGEARRRRHGRRRRLRRRRRAHRDGQGVPALASSTATRSRSTRSSAPPPTSRSPGSPTSRSTTPTATPCPTDAPLRLRHHLRLPARHGEPRAGDRRHPPRHQAGRHVADRRHQEPPHLRGQPLYRNSHSSPLGFEQGRSHMLPVNVAGRLRLTVRPSRASKRPNSS